MLASHRLGRFAFDNLLVAHSTRLARNDLVLDFLDHFGHSAVALVQVDDFDVQGRLFHLRLATNALVKHRFAFSHWCNLGSDGVREFLGQFGWKLDGDRVAFGAKVGCRGHAFAKRLFHWKIRREVSGGFVGWGWGGVETFGSGIVDRGDVRTWGVDCWLRVDFIGRFLDRHVVGHVHRVGLEVSGDAGSGFLRVADALQVRHALLGVVFFHVSLR